VPDRQAHHHPARSAIRGTAVAGDCAGAVFFSRRFGSFQGRGPRARDRRGSSRGARVRTPATVGSRPRRGLWAHRAHGKSSATLPRRLIRPMDFCSPPAERIRFVRTGSRSWGLSEGSGRRVGRHVSGVLTIPFPPWRGTRAFPFLPVGEHSEAMKRSTRAPDANGRSEREGEKSFSVRTRRNSSAGLTGMEGARRCVAKRLWSDRWTSIGARSARRRAPWHTSAAIAHTIRRTISCR